MPSPFPGMDPYLEDPGHWPDVHHEIISEARAFLGVQLRPKYQVRIEDRVYISDENDPGRSVIVPDIRIAAQPSRQGHAFEPREAGGVDVVEPVVATTMIDDEIREARLEIVDRESRLVVTVIEFLSPTNKVVGSRGRASFELKRQEVMNSPSHWVEIDLLRGGVGVRTREALPPCDYLAHVSRVEMRPKGLNWLIQLSQRLPVLPIPLREGDADGSLDLQAVLATAYDRARYDLSIGYDKDPVPPLTGEWVEWSDRLLKAGGLRIA